MYLVVNNSKNGFYSYADQYQIFEKFEDAEKHFVEIGGETMFGLSQTPGVATIDKGGLIDIIFLPLEVQ